MNFSVEIKSGKNWNLLFQFELIWNGIGMNRSVYIIVLSYQFHKTSYLGKWILDFEMLKFFYIFSVY